MFDTLIPEARALCKGSYFFIFTASLMEESTFDYLEVVAMNMIATYIIVGIIVYAIYWVIAMKKITEVPLRKILLDLLHPFIFIVLWPIDFVWSVYRLYKDPIDFKEGYEETVNEYL